MTDYDKYAAMAREIWHDDEFNVPNKIFMGRIARALERAALEAQGKLLQKMQLCRKRIWVPTDVPNPKFQEIAEGAVPMWFVDKELERLRTRLDELDTEAKATK